jgi:hypothetical protein
MALDRLQELSPENLYYFTSPGVLDTLTVFLPPTRIKYQDYTGKPTYIDFANRAKGTINNTQIKSTNLDRVNVDKKLEGKGVATSLLLAYLYISRFQFKTDTISTIIVSPRMASVWLKTLGTTNILVYKEGPARFLENWTNSTNKTKAASSLIFLEICRDLSPVTKEDLTNSPRWIEPIQIDAVEYGLTNLHS